MSAHPIISYSSEIPSNLANLDYLEPTPLHAHQYALVSHKFIFAQAIAYCRIRYGEAIFRHQAVLNLLYNAKLNPRIVEEGLNHLIKTNQLSSAVQGAANAM